MVHEELRDRLHYLIKGGIVEVTQVMEVFPEKLRGTVLELSRRVGVTEDFLKFTTVATCYDNLPGALSTLIDLAPSNRFPFGAYLHNQLEAYRRREENEIPHTLSKLEASLDRSR